MSGDAEESANGAGSAGGVAPEAALVIDTLGQRCPAPVLALARRIAEVPVGAVVAVLSDDSGARADIPVWCRMRDQDYLGEQRLVTGPGVAYLVGRRS